MLLWSWTSKILQAKFWWFLSRQSSQFLQSIETIYMIYVACYQGKYKLNLRLTDQLLDDLSIIRWFINYQMIYQLLDDLSIIRWFINYQLLDDLSRKECPTAFWYHLGQPLSRERWISTCIKQVISQPFNTVTVVLYDLALHTFLVGFLVKKNLMQIKIIVSIDFLVIWNRFWAWYWDLLFWLFSET